MVYTIMLYEMAQCSVKNPSKSLPLVDGSEVQVVTVTVIGNNKHSEDRREKPTPVVSNTRSKSTSSTYITRSSTVPALTPPSPVAAEPTRICRLRSPTRRKSLTRRRSGNFSLPVRYKVKVAIITACPRGYKYTYGVGYVAGAPTA